MLTDVKLMKFSEKIKSKARQLGFDVAGITDAGSLSCREVEIFQKWLQDGYAADMNYMKRNFEKRVNPEELLKGTKSVIVAGLNYKVRGDKKIAEKSKAAGRISDHAKYEDYHMFIKNRLYELANFINEKTDENFKFKVCVDSVPIAERAFAKRAGLGFIGKNHMLIHPEKGPCLFLGEIVCNIELAADEPIDKGCSRCNACISSCPTGALKADGKFDANKCISYLTIEHKGEIPEKLKEKIEGRLFGCDECLKNCPYYAKAPVCSNNDFHLREDLLDIDLYEIMEMDEDDFRSKFKGTNIERTGLESLKRNAEICLNNILRKK